MQKQIFFFWSTGLEDAPPIARACHRSWVEINPGWEVIVVTRSNIGHFLDLDEIIGPNHGAMEMQAMTNIIRINLLKIYGGIWVDSTVLCRKPLDTWINQFLLKGFFAFDRPGVGRPIATWFLAGRRSLLVDRFAECTNEFWRSNPFPNTPSSYGVDRAQRHGKANSLRFDGSPLDDLPPFDPDDLATWGLQECGIIGDALARGDVPDHLAFSGVHCYFWMHVLFGSLVRTDPAFAAEWDEAPRFSAHSPHALRSVPQDIDIDQDFINMWFRGVSPCFKLDNWTMNADSPLLTFALDPANW